MRTKVLRAILADASERAARVVEQALQLISQDLVARAHLAMRGAPVRTIQELAGHASITTTMRYMHLTPSAAIALLEQPISSQRHLNTADRHEKLT